VDDHQPVEPAGRPLDHRGTERGHGEGSDRHGKERTKKDGGASNISHDGPPSPVAGEHTPPHTRAGSVRSRVRRVNRKLRALSLEHRSGGVYCEPAARPLCARYGFFWFRGSSAGLTYLKSTGPCPCRRMTVSCLV